MSNKSILKRLDQYVGDLLDDDDYKARFQKPKKKKKKTKHSQELEEFNRKYGVDDDELETEDGDLKISLTNEEIDVKTDKNDTNRPKRKGKKKHLDMIRDILDLKTETFVDDQKEHIPDRTVEPVKRKSGHREVEVVVFEERMAKKRKADETIKGDDGKETEGEVFNMKKARHDVQKLGITGFTKGKKRRARKEIAVKLGAKTGKQNNVPYKDYVESQRVKKEIAREQRELDKKLGFKVKDRDKYKRSRIHGDVGHADGQIGRFRSGIQMLKKDDVEKIRKSKVKRTR